MKPLKEGDTAYLIRHNGPHVTVEEVWVRVKLNDHEYDVRTVRRASDYYHAHPSQYMGKDIRTTLPLLHTDPALAIAAMDASNPRHPRGKDWAEHYDVWKARTADANSPTDDELLEIPE